ncbi:kinase-like domain-containing protein [Verticillium dahliae]|nr:kinase-like domain-containing protein [Verticillium dahliae]
MTSSGLGLALSSDTNPFTSSELQFRGNTAAAVAGPASQAASGDTEPFSSDDHRLRADDASASDSRKVTSEPCQATVRIILEPASAALGSISFDYSPLDGTGSARRHRVVLGASSNMNGGRSVNKFAIAQSSKHVVISKAPIQDLAPRAVSSKRPLEISQPLDLAKRGKYDDDKQAEEGIVRSTVIVFQSVPLAPLTDVSASTTGQGHDVPLVAHPLEQLRMGDKADIIGLGGEEYVLTREANIMTTRNTQVFQAQHSQLPGDMAVVKVIRTPSHDIQLGASDPSAMKISRAAEMWLKEYKNHSKLSQHTTVVRLHEADARFLSLYMEHVDAPALASCRGQDPNPMCTLSEADALRVMADITTALLYIQEQGIVHNDIKPANILYSPTRGAVLIDFGLSSELSNKTRIHNGGSPWYVPPDYLTTGERGPSGDVFALGVVMLFLLRKLPLPELRSPRLNWIIADVRTPGSGRGEEVREAMSRWQEIVRKASQLLDIQKLKPDRLVHGMLANNTRIRIGVRDLIDSLS